MKLRRWAFIAAVGLAPLWVTAIYLYIAGRSQGPEYWNVAPWFLFMAVPACVVTLAMARIAVAIHDRVEGGPGRKLGLAGLALGAMAGLCVAAAWMWMRHRDAGEAADKAQSAAAEAFVVADERVRRAAGGTPSANTASSVIPRGSARPTRHDVSVTGKGKARFHVIVDVAHGNDGRPRFRLACLTRLSLGQRAAGVDDCAQDESRGSGSFADTPPG